MLTNILYEDAIQLVGYRFTEFHNLTLHWTDYEDTTCILNLLKNRNQILEIGTYLGYTCENILRNCSGKVTTVDIHKGMVDSLEFQSHEILDEKESGKEIRSNLDRVTKVFSTSDNFFEGCEKDKFDAIFIDGDHSYAQVKKDSENAFKVIKKNGIIIWHDVYNLDSIMDRKRNAEPNNDGVVRVLKEIPQTVYKIDRSWVAFSLT